VFVLGDSHAWAFGKLHLTTAARLGTEVDVFHNAGCSVFRLWGSQPDLRTGPCYEFRMSALAAIAAEANPNDVLFLPALRTARYREGSEGPFTENADLELDFVQTDRREAEASYAELEPLLAAGVRVVLEAPAPVFRAQPYRCADWFTRNNPACAAGFSVPRAELEVRRDRPLRTEQYLATLSRGITIWDPFPLLCPGQVCESFDGDEPLYWDADHVSGYANRMLAPAFIAHLEQLDP
jgi:hypothetical protein